MQLSELRTLVLANTNRSDKTSIIDLAINLALREIDSRHNFNYSRKTTELSVVSGDNTVTLPADYKAAIELRLSDSSTTLVTTIKLLPKLVLLKLYPSEQTIVLGRPLLAYVEGGVLHFMPPASQDFIVTMTYDGTHPTLSVDSDSTLGSIIDNAVVAWATSYVFRSITMYSDSQFWANEYQRALLEAVRGDQRKPGELRQMRGANPLTALNSDILGSGDPYENKFTPD